MSITDDTQAPIDPATIDLTERGSAPVIEPSDPGQAGASAGGRPQFSITDAAVACAVSRKTITRKLADLAEHGAAKDDDGVWRIPVEALLAVGLHPGRSVPERPGPERPTSSSPQGAAQPAAPSLPPRGPDMISVPRDRWDDLRIRVARAEAQAAERELALADARLALRALTAGPASTAPAAPAPPLPPTSPAPSAGAPIAVGAATSEGPAPAQSEAQVPGRAPLPAVAPAAQVTGPAVAGGPAADPAAQVALARAEAARTGGYVPAGGPTAKRRRWWHGKGA